jgi:CubicO group peptidase (beta-lactamase class C family)
MSHTPDLALVDFVRAKAVELEVPGASVGVIHDGIEHYAFAGVTSLENPLPVNADTLFQIGSTTKTVTATAIMLLAERDLLELDAPVRRYVPDLVLQDESVAEKVTVLQLLNHTAGWSGDLMQDTGDGDDALAQYVALMATIEQVSPLGAEVSYNNASLSLAGRVIEKVTGQTYEQSVRDLLLDPLQLSQSWFFPKELMTRRFAVGHNQRPNGTIQVARTWALSRATAPAGGITANAADQVAWARFHLGDGTAPDGQRLLSAELLARMQQPTVETPGGAMGDAMGIGWMLKDVDGVRLVFHGGTTNGQHSSFVMVPERGFGITSMTNCGPNGPQLNDAVVAWALEHYLDVKEAKPELLELSESELAPYVGTFETIAVTCEITRHGSGLLLEVDLKAQTRAALASADDDGAAEAQPPLPLALIAGGDDQYVVTGGPAQGMRGFFNRDATGMIVSVHVGGRTATRV